MEQLNLNLRQMSPLKFGNVTAPFAKCMIMSTILSSTITLKLLKRKYFTFKDWNQGQ